MESEHQYRHRKMIMADRVILACALILAALVAITVFSV
jgi:hypothetical protein